MHLLSTFVFAFSANIDNFSVGIAYGAKKIRIGLITNLLIAVISVVITYISMSLGLFVIRFLPVNCSNILGCSIFISIGLYFIYDSIKMSFLKKIRKNADDPTGEIEIKDGYPKDRVAAEQIQFKESIIIAFSLTLNNFGLGLGASISGLNIFLTCLMTFLLSVLSIILGVLIGKSYFIRIFGKYAPVLSGIVIIVLGLYEMIS